MTLLQRAASLSGFLEQLNDLDADFLALYGIDLEVDDISGPRFFLLAARTYAYDGVMRRRLEAKQTSTGTQSEPVHEAEPRTYSWKGSWAEKKGAREVPLASMMIQNPGLISVSKVGG